MFNPKKLIANCGILGTEVRGLIPLKSPQSKMKAMINRGRGGGFPQVQPVIPHLDHGTQQGTAQAMQKPTPQARACWRHEVTLPRRRMELLVSLAKLELDKVVLREMRTGMRVIEGR